MRNKLLRKMLVIGITVLFVGLIIVPSINSQINLRQKNTSAGLASFNPFKEGWEYRKKVTINHNKVDGNLASFPVLVSTTDTDLRDKAQIDGDDILFMDDKGKANQLYHEIEYYDETSGKLVAWVNIPSLSSAVDTVFYMYYGNLQCASQEYPEMVWDSDYIHVWHLGDSLSDSAGYDDGNDYGTSLVSGKIGEARDFERSQHDYIDFGDMAQPGDGSLTTMTWEGWFKPGSITIPSILMSKYDTSGEDYQSYGIDIRENGKFFAGAYSGYPVSTHGITVNSYATVGQWIYLTATFTLGGTNDIDAFIDGDEVSFTMLSSSANIMSNIHVTDELGRARHEGATAYSDGVIDEVRWSKVVRSDDWIKTSFNTMNNPSSFLTIGPEEPKNRAYINTPLLNFLQQHPNLFPILRLLMQRLGLQ